MTIRIPRPDGERQILLPAFGGAVGGLTYVDVGGGIGRVTAPAGGAMTTPATAPGFLWWDTGYTVADLLDRYTGVRLSNVSIPVGTSADVVLGTGLLFKASGTPTISDDFIWAQNNFGLAAAANTTAEVVTRRSSNGIISFATVADFDHSDLMLRMQSVGNERETFVGHFAGAAARTVHTSVDSTAITDTHKVYGIVIVGRSAVEASPIDVDFMFEFIPPGAS